MRRLSYAGTFTNPYKAGAIRVIEWMTGKLHLIRKIREFERSGVPFGQPFFTKAMQAMGIDVLTPEEQVALIPKEGPLVVVANHPHGLVDGLIMGELVGRVRTDYKILTRSLLTGIPEIEDFMLPVPFPHEENAREQSLEMRNTCMAHLKNGGVIILFPAGKVATSKTMFGPVIEPEWNPFTAKMVLRSGATVLPIFFPGRNTRLYHAADKISATVRQGLLLHEIRKALYKPQTPVIGQPITPEELKSRASDTRGLLAWLRETTLALGAHPPR
ncbi:lysophospholipid acyltransferase family protein [Defluviimonas aestuarii]|jgi:putative hemolysin|uniref:lysophospholipid acyltransferase family protein n=1 Tax=Albidovulum aestuarii TaxID=1130726 RepID=UPI00249AB459|nr:lysophospholipid acyltransferase family protein [Defluviimonas aestuarii]MDI3337893.1 lysophospholipid acyltransferase family protein [Defluviimonas aestuarii]